MQMQPQKRKICRSRQAAGTVFRRAGTGTGESMPLFFSGRTKSTPEIGNGPV
jgi:hypothetical protein